MKEPLVWEEGSHMGVPVLENKIQDIPVNFEFQINSEFFFFFSLSMSLEIVGIYLYQKPKSVFTWNLNILYFISCEQNTTPKPGPKRGDDYIKLITHCIALAMVITLGWLDYSIQDNQKGTF